MTNPVLLKLEGYAALTNEDKALITKVIATEHHVERRIDIIREEAAPIAFT